MDVEDNTKSPKSKTAGIQQEDLAKDYNDASPIKSLSNLPLPSANTIPKDKIDLELRKSSKKNHDLIKYFHNSNNHFIDSLREHAKDKLEDPDMIKKSILESFRLLQLELNTKNKEKNKEIKDDLPKKEENSDKNDNKNVDTTEAALNSLVEECEKADDDDDDDEDDDHDEDNDYLESDSDDDIIQEDTINYIDDFLTFLNDKEHINVWPNAIMHKLDTILRMSKKKRIALYMMEYDVLQKIMDKLQTNPEFVEIILNIILNVHEAFDETIDWIGNYKEFVKLILQQLKSTNDSILINLMKILKLAVGSIQTNRYSRWLENLQKHESFANEIIALFKLQFNETLITEATELLKDIAQTKLSNQPSVFQQLFNGKIPELIPVLMMSCTHMLIKKKNIYPKNSGYIYNWITVMMVVKSHLAIIFEKSEEKEKYILLKIIFVLLHPYQKANSLFPEQNLKQDLEVIYKSMCLLEYIHRNFYIPLMMERNLMRIILNLQAVITDDIDFEEEEVKNLMRKLLTYLRDLWGITIKHRNSASIAELWRAFTETECQYFIELAKNHPKIKYHTRIMNDLTKSLKNN